MSTPLWRGSTWPPSPGRSSTRSTCPRSCDSPPAPSRPRPCARSATRACSRTRPSPASSTGCCGVGGRRRRERAAGGGQRGPGDAPAGGGGRRDRGRDRDGGALPRCDGRQLLLVTAAVPVAATEPVDLDAHARGGRGGVPHGRVGDHRPHLRRHLARGACPRAESQQAGVGPGDAAGDHLRPRADRTPLARHQPGPSFLAGHPRGGGGRVRPVPRPRSTRHDARAGAVPAEEPAAMSAQDGHRERQLLVPRRVAVRSLLRSAALSVSLILAYYLLPLQPGTGAALTWLVGGLTLVVVVIATQLRAILSAKYPWLRTITVLAVGTPLLIVAFAATYYLMAASDPASFSQPLDRTAALYFTVTVLATVGFGDIVPVTAIAR